MPNFLPKIEFGLTPGIIKFNKPPEGDYLNTDIDASETTNRSFNGKVQTSWGYNQVSINPHFKLVPENIKRQMDVFFNSIAATGQMFKYFPHSDGAEYYVCISKNKKFTPKVIAIQSQDPNTLTTNFFWEFDLPMLVVDPGNFAVSGAPVTSVNTRIGNVFVREIYNQSETDIIAQGTDTGLDAKIIVVPDETLLLPEKGRLAFDDSKLKLIFHDGNSWQEIGGGGGAYSPNDQTVVDGGEILLSDKQFQSIILTSVGLVTLSPTPLGTIRAKDRTTVILIGTSDIDSQVIQFSDIDDGIILNGSANLRNNSIITLQWLEPKLRWLEVSRSF